MIGESWVPMHSGVTVGRMDVSPGFTIEDGADGRAANAEDIGDLIGGEAERAQAEDFGNSPFAQLGAGIF